jgi:6-phosphogluconolactonase (cycloisomerase 2 family)
MDEETQDFVFIQGSPSSQWLYSPHKEKNKIDIEATYTFNKSDDNLSAIYGKQTLSSESHSASGETKLKLTLSVDPEKGSISQIDVTSLLLNWEIKDKPTSASLSSQ